MFIVVLVAGWEANLIAHVDILLGRWARWIICSESRAVGYPSTSPMFRDTPSTGVFCSREPFGFSGSDYKDVTKAVDSLPIVLKHCVLEYYQRPGKAEETAQRLGLKKSVMFKYLHNAHEQIDNLLSTIA